MKYKKKIITAFVILFLISAAYTLINLNGIYNFSKKNESVVFQNSGYANNIIGSEIIHTNLDSNTQEGVLKSSAFKVPILMYHHLDEDEAKTNSMIITPVLFRRHMEALKNHGYTTVSFIELLDFVEGRASLPEKPLVITLDDGYKSNYTYAYPILKELGMKATIFVIGHSVGVIKNQEPGISIIPHFSYKEAKEMYLSGFIDIQSHSWNMHVNIDPTGEKARHGILQMKNESTKDYSEAFRNDYTKTVQQIEQQVGNRVFAYSYPYGLYTSLSEKLLLEMDNIVTLTTKSGINLISSGNYVSLLLLKRNNIPGTMDEEALLINLENLYQ